MPKAPSKKNIKDKSKTDVLATDKNIVKTDFADEMKQSFLDYSMSVITSRAIPDVRDGLKPVHRRIIYTMKDLGLASSKGYKKCANVVGTALAKYHSHGDSSVYEALVNMTHDFSLTAPLVDGQGNLGSIEGDPYAAYRYCISGDTLILTNKGIMPIRDLERFAEDENLNGIQTLDMNNLWVDATKFFNSGEHDVYLITLKNGLSIKATGNHPILSTVRNTNFEWKLTENLTDKDSLVIPLFYSGNINNEGISNEQTLEARALGYIMSSGKIIKNSLVFQCKDEETVFTLSEWFKTISSDVGYCVNPTENGFLISTKDDKIFNKLKSYGCNLFGKQKKIPNKIFLSSSLTTIFLHSFAKYNAQVFSKEKGIVIRSESRLLINQLMSIFVQFFGLYPELKIVKKDDTNTYAIKLSGTNIIKYIERVGFSDKNNREKSSEIVNSYSFYRFKSVKEEKKGYIITPIVNIKKLPKKETVYSVKIDNPSSDHSFIAGGFINHNTECKLQPYAEDVFLQDLNKNIVEFIPNFDNTTIEPAVFPTKIPHSIINGSDGIAVGMVTNTPPHNLKEVLEGYKLFLKNKKITIKELMEVVKGPDFPTGGIIANKSDLYEIYNTGIGKIRLRGKVDFEPATKKGERDKIVISEVPYTMTGAGIRKFLSDVCDLAKDKVLPEIVDVLNQTSAEGVRLVLEVKPDSDIKRIENILYKKTKLEDTFSVYMTYIVDGRPETLSLKEIYENFTEFRVQTIKNKYNYQLKLAKEMLEIKTGLIVAIDMIDAIIETLRGSKSVKQAKDCLMGKSLAGITFKTKKAETVAKKFAFTELQAQAILDMRLSKLVNLELNALLKEKEDAEKTIKKCESILASKTKIIKIIQDDVEEFIAKYSKKRKTKIADLKTVDIDINTVEEMDLYVVCDKFGYLKAFDTATYERNKETIDTECLIAKCKNTDAVFVFTDKGNLYQIKTSLIPLCKMRDRGTPIDNISDYQSTKEKFISLESKEDLSKNAFIIISRSNLIKRVAGTEFITSRKALNYSKLFNNEDEILCVVSDKAKSIQVTSNMGKTAKIKALAVPERKRSGMGVKCLKIKENDFLKSVVFS